MKTCKTSANDLSSQGKTWTETHMLYSMLPKQFQLYEKTQFKKTKDFYRPGECIWNNPHRTSDKFYKYYHKGIDKYNTIKQPQIREKEKKQREEKQTNRLVRLSQKRQEVRQKFLSKKLARIQMQQKIGIRKEYPNQLNRKIFQQDFCNTLQTQTFDQNLKQQLILKRSTSEIIKKPSQTASNQIFIYKKLKTKGQQKQNMSKNQISYFQGIRNFDIKKQQTIQILKRYEDKMRSKIRQNFVKQRQTNTLNQSFFKQSRFLNSSSNQLASLNNR